MLARTPVVGALSQLKARGNEPSALPLINSTVCTGDSFGKSRRPLRVLSGYLATAYYALYRVFRVAAPSAEEEGGLPKKAPQDG